MSGDFTKGAQSSTVVYIDASARAILYPFILLFQNRGFEDSVHILLDPVVASVRKRVVCTGVWAAGGFGVGRVAFRGSAGWS